MTTYYLVTFDTIREGPVTRHFPTTEARDAFLRQLILAGTEEEWLADAGLTETSDLTDLEEEFGYPDPVTLTEITV